MAEIWRFYGDPTGSSSRREFPDFFFPHDLRVCFFKEEALGGCPGGGCLAKVIGYRGGANPMARVCGIAVTPQITTRRGDCGRDAV